MLFDKSINFVLFFWGGAKWGQDIFLGGAKWGQDLQKSLGFDHFRGQDPQKVIGFDHFIQENANFFMILQ